MNVFLNQLLDYNFYCNKEIINAFMVLETVPERSRQLFNHLLNAHHIWNCRILAKPADYDIWQEHPIEQWEDIHYENQRNTFEIITNEEDFENRIDYENSEGRLFTNTVQDIIFHIINHSTHHRAQILANLRANNIEPKPLDYIFYKR